MWEDAVQAARQRHRRYSYDSKMAWKTMPTEFIEQASLLNELKRKPIQLPPPSSSTTSSVLSSPHKWYHEDYHPHHPHRSIPLSSSSSSSSHHPHHPHQQQPMYHPIMYPPIHPSNNNNNNNNNNNDHPSYLSMSTSSSTTTTSSSSTSSLSSNNNNNYTYPPSSHHPYANYYFPNKLPLPNHPPPPSSHESNNNSESMMMHPHASLPPMNHHHQHPNYVLPPPPGHPLHLHPQQQPPYPPSTHPHHHHQQQPHILQHQASTMNPVKPKRKRREHGELEENFGCVMPGDADFPDMSERDVEAARHDVDARPRRQKLRYIGDMYTPQWVRYNGQAKEGLCDTCKPGKWLQLKNSAFWYHKQFYHGISSVSGKEFMQPLETRWVDQDIVEGLCHQCQQWVSVSNVKRKNSVLWYRHAHKCHVYHKPKSGSPKRR
ncbi:hypothetical protein BJ944DRAFT_189044 [Cunninghamella echinulata]|nr:hypothetical protein BJ944DRAFT_189044 [Cunninghamella echinulata]